jgi:hypothetical protein
MSLAFNPELIKIDYPTTLEFDNYSQITCSDEQLKAIKFIMTTLNEGLSKAFNLRNELLKKGQILKTLHPFKNLAIILVNPELKKIYNTIFLMYSFNPIRKNFFKQFIKAFQAPIWEKTLLQDNFLIPFASEIDKNPDRLKELLAKKEWEQFFEEIGK